MRWHIYTQALHEDQHLAAGHILYFFTDSAGTTLATLYVSDTGVSTHENPYTVPYSGIVDFWTSDPTLWYRTSLSSELRPLNVNMNTGPGPLNVRDFGAVGDGVANDTAAFVLAIDAQRELSQASFLNDGDMRQSAPPIHIPAGRYVVNTGAFLIDYSSGAFVGDGEFATYLIVPEDDDGGHLFHIGAEDLELTPAYYWLGANGVGMHFECRGMSITAPAGFDWHGDTLTQARVGTCFYDNAVGNMKLLDVTVTGFEYGFCAPYGHDFGYHYNCNYMMCDVGIYLGPGSEQVYLYGMNVGICHENIVMEDCVNILWSGLNLSTPISGAGRVGADIVFESGTVSDATRFGVTRIWTGSCRAITIDNLWEERVWDDGVVGGDFRTATQVDQNILLSGAEPHYGIVFNNAFVSALRYGGESSTGKAWMRLGGDQDGAIVAVNNPHFMNPTGLFEAVFSMDGVNAHVHLNNPILSGGYWPPESFTTEFHLFVAGETEPVGYLVTKPAGFAGFPGSVMQAHPWDKRISLADPDGGGGQSIWFGTPAGISFGGTYDSGATWFHNIGVNPIGDGVNGYLVFGDQDGDKNIVTYQGAIPGTGTWRKGDIIFNTQATPGGNAGWVCTTSGAIGAGAVFKTFGTIEA